MQAVTKSLVENAKKVGVKIRGPVRLPNKHLRICCRRTPCGEGSKTWDNWEMTVFKRYIDLECTAGQIKEVTSITIPNGIEISVDFRTTA
jgi:small subunit ribosomal protein S20e